MSQAAPASHDGNRWLLQELTEPASGGTRHLRMLGKDRSGPDRQLWGVLHE